MSVILIKPKRVTGLEPYYGVSGFVRKVFVRAGSIFCEYLRACGDRFEGVFKAVRFEDVDEVLADLGKDVVELEWRVANGVFDGVGRALDCVSVANGFVAGGAGSLVHQVAHLRSDLGKVLGKKALVLDLDETLVHAHMDLDGHYDALLEFWTKDNVEVLAVNLRPHLRTFLMTVAMWYDVYIFTAAAREYADPLVNMIDVGGVVKGRFFRDSCLTTKLGSVKDLSLVQNDLRKVLIIDNSSVSYALQEDNAVPISTWTHDPLDEQLLNVLPLLENLANVADVRSILSLRHRGPDAGLDFTSNPEYV
ncbi:hypothetical protein NDN08_007265 [Rhodosorus marinus]|uniref:FCP1 homology domain-containing protein n=1 Tax=Rhodosorus marinus TaxID=101924 RepID=A0AAV8UHG0_9RHOD|nr:hypothetical protein NDN08_007265 [Rhodosorus marinus]